MLFFWPSRHLFATLGKQMHFGFPFGGVQRVFRTPQLHGRVKNLCDVAHTDTPTQHTRYMICRQRKVCYRTRTGTDAFSVVSCVLHPCLLLSPIPFHISSFLLWKRRRQRKPNHHRGSLATERDHGSGMCMCMYVCVSVSVHFP